MKILALALALLPSVALAAASDPLSPLDFLIGDWQGTSPGNQGSDSFHRELGGKVILRNAESQPTPADGKTGPSMQMTMTIFPAGDSLHAIYFDNAGHVIHYRTGRVVPGSLVEFLSDGTDPGPRFRLTYTQTGKGALHVRFEMAPPDRPEAFDTIAEGDDHRKP